MSVWEGDMRALFAITIVAAASISGAWSAMAQYGPARELSPNLGDKRDQAAAV